MTEVGVREKLSIKETSEAVSYFIHVTAALKDIKQIPAELADLDLEEVDALIEIVVTNYSYENEKAKAIVAASIRALRANYEVYLLLRE